MIDLTNKNLEGSEEKFEDQVIEILKKNGWEFKDLKNEEDLKNNFIGILNSQNQDVLQNRNLRESEIQQIWDKIDRLSDPNDANKFINGKTMEIKRYEENATRTINLKLYNRQDVALGGSKYEVARQVRMKNKLTNTDCKADLLLLINGMPVIHLELKKNNVSVDEAIGQLKEYYKKGIYQGIFNLIQIFVGLTPTESKYFAKYSGKINKNYNYVFEWKTDENYPLVTIEDIIKGFLKIPIAHQLIGYYTVCDKTDGVFKILRSYQYHAVEKIIKKINKLKKDWDSPKIKLGGYVWHATGSGKTLTSFKAAEQISLNKVADKVIFLVDRIELRNQSVTEYSNFSYSKDDVTDGESIKDLAKKIASNKTTNDLIIGSIQMLSKINDENEEIKTELAAIKNKKIVIIVDECHRSTFGDMMQEIKKFFSNAILFGFTGTPIFSKNNSSDMITEDIFGKQLCRYTLAEGVNDGNILNLERFFITTLNYEQLENQIVLNETRSQTLFEVTKSPQKLDHYNKEPDYSQMMPDFESKEEYKERLQEAKLGPDNYNENHKRIVIKNILRNWIRTSKNYKYSGILATSSIKDAYEYFGLFHKIQSEERSKNYERNIRITAIFDIGKKYDATDNDEKVDKVEVEREIIEKYNETFGINIKTWTNYRKDVAYRLAHKANYKGIETHENEAKRIDLVIVVNQLLTGYDSKFVNAVFFDKVMSDNNLIQAISRTNRKHDENKKFGIIKFFRKPTTMLVNLKKATYNYSGGKEINIFVDKLDKNIEKINEFVDKIDELFEGEITDNKLLDDDNVKIFDKLFRDLSRVLKFAINQGFDFKEYEECEIENTNDVNEYNIRKNFKIVHNKLTKEKYQIIFEKHEEFKKCYAKDPTFNKGNPFPFYVETTEYVRNLGKFNFSEIEIHFKRRDKEKYYKEIKKLPTKQKRKFAEMLGEEFFKGKIKIENDDDFGRILEKFINNYKTKNLEKISSILGINKVELEYYLNKINLNLLNEGGRFDDLKKKINYSLMEDYILKKRNDLTKVNLSHKDNLLRIIVKNRNNIAEFDIDDEIRKL